MLDAVPLPGPWQLPALGLALLALAAILYRVADAQRDLLRALRVTEVIPVSELLELHGRVAGEIGPGLFRKQVAVEGTIACDAPLLSELGQVPCVAFWYRVERQWEERYERRDPDGTVHRGTRTGRDRVAGNERRVPFWVGDVGGRLLVRPDGATLDTETTVDRFEPGSGGGLMRVGTITVDLGRFLGNGGGRRTVGYHFHEEVLPLDRAAYVLGSASDTGGELAICRSPDPGDRFLISLKTRDQLVAVSRQATVYTRYGSLASGALGLAVLLFWLLVRLG